MLGWSFSQSVKKLSRKKTDPGRPYPRTFYKALAPHEPNARRLSCGKKNEPDAPAFGISLNSLKARVREARQYKWSTS